MGNAFLTTWTILSLISNHPDQVDHGSLSGSSATGAGTGNGGSSTNLLRTV